MKHSEIGNYKPATGVRALVISSQDSHLADLQDVFNSCGWEMYCVPSLRDGFSSFQYMAPVIVICDDQLADGDWKLALDAIMKADCPPPMIVTSRIADNHMWAEVLNLGAYDLLAKPYDAAAVIQVVGSAWGCANRLLLTARRQSPSMFKVA